MMHNPENKTKALCSENSQTFNKPPHLEEKLVQIMNEIRVHSERNQKDKEYFAVKV